MIYHYVEGSYLDGLFGGVPRFDFELHKTISELKTIKINDDIKFKDNDIVITGNDLCNKIPNHITCIVVHHGLARVHQEREPDWDGTHYVIGQDKMIHRPNTIFVAPSSYCEKQFFKYYNKKDDYKIFHSVDTKPLGEPKREKIIIGDWRNNNKGSNIIDKLRETKKFKFINLKCDKYHKSEAYSQASIYLTLSLSEGCSYSQLDALACDLPVLSTNVSLFDGDCDDTCGLSIDWTERENIDLIIDKLEYIYNNYTKFNPRTWLLKKNNFETWKLKWKELIDEVYKN